MVLKQFEAYLKIFKIDRKKVQGVTIGPEGGQLEKNFFEKCFYKFKMIVLMKENVFDGFKAIWSLIKNFQNWSKKS